MKTSQPWTLKPERLVGDNAREIVWLRLRRLTSAKIARRVIEESKPDMNAARLDAKADGLASAVRSMIGYWQEPAESLNARILSRYYALLQATVAEQVAYADAAIDLASVEKHTKRGHGLAIIDDGPGDFPHSYFVGCMNSGHYQAYCKYRGVNMKPFVLARRPDTWEGMDDADRQAAVSLADLLRRVPELQPMIRETLSSQPLSIRIGYNFKRNADASSAKFWNTRGAAPSPGAPNVERTLVSIYPQDASFGLEDLHALELPLDDLEADTDADNTPIFLGSFAHPPAELWWNHIEHYKSSYCGTSVIAPFWGTRDPLLLHLAILYACSIIVRYQPSLWRQVHDGDLDHIYALLEQYMAIVDSVIPLLALQHITARTVRVTSADGLNAPV